MSHNPKQTPTPDSPHALTLLYRAPILSNAGLVLPLIVHEDDHLLVINKPAGWNTHAPSPYAGEGVYDWLKHREPRWANLAIIHRLDKETSGLLAFGKTPLANKSLTEQFTNRSVTKLYSLVTDRTVLRDHIIARSTITRSGERYVVSRHGEAAETHFTLLKRDGNRTILEARPLTGRTHQIRVHAAEHGFPILGDTLYGGTEAPRVHLHAAQLTFVHPATGEKVTFEAKPNWEPSAAALRDAIIEPKVTNAFRLVHGSSDAWPGTFIEKLGDWLLVQADAPLSRDSEERTQALAREHGAKGVYFKLLDRNVRKTSGADASPRHVFDEPAPERFTICENGLTFEMSFQEGYSVGLFLDQRDNRRRLITGHVAANFALWKRNGTPEVLNAFAYTCGFSAAAARGGARVTSLDLSKKYLEWGKRNFALNDLNPAHHDFIYGDAFDWLRRLAKKGRAYDAIILDPPTFSQSKESGTWQAERDYGKLVSATLPLLKPDGVLLASTNAARLEPEQFLTQITRAIASAGRKVTQQHYVPQPPDFPISRAEPAYLKTVWMRVAGGA